MKNLALHWQIIIGLALGVVWAFVSSALGWSQFTLNWIDPFGEIFINSLKLIAVPLVLFSIIKGITGLSDVTKLGRLGLKTISFYLGSTVLAVGLGLLLVNTLKPGTFIDDGQRMDNRRSYEAFVSQRDGIELMDDKQLFSESELDGSVTEDSEMSEPEVIATEQLDESSPLQFLVDMVPSNVFASLTDNSLMLQVIVFSIFFGVTVLLVPRENTTGIMSFIDGMNDVFLKMVDIIMKGAPFFVFALLAGKISEMAGDNPANVVEIFKGLAWYSLTVVAGLALLIFIIYPVIVMIFTKRSYGSFFKGLGPAQMLAFSTSSSVATLPVTMECVNDNLKVPKEITSFVLPIGATINMDGTSLYQAIAVVFLAQFHMVDLTLGQQLTIVLTASLASIGSAAVPSAGLVMMIIVLESVGLDPSWVAIIFPVDRILDMGRTVVNVTGDATVATLVASSENALPEKYDRNIL